MQHFIYPILIVFLCLTACQSDTSKGKDVPGKREVKKDTIVVKDTIARLKLCFIGDIMAHGAQIRSAALNKDMDSFNYEPWFRYVKPIFEANDLAIGNLELTLNGKKRYTGYPMFRSPDTMATFLKNAGLDVLVTSNNHSNDNKLYGVLNTLDQLDKVGIQHTGTFRDSAEWRKTYPLLVEKEIGETTFRLGLLNYTYGTNGMPTYAPSVVNLIDTARMRQDLNKAKKMDVDFIIVCMHWGGEYRLQEHPTQVRWSQFLAENGADLIIGAHPHVIEPIKKIRLYNADSSLKKEVTVAYSLGNFVSNQFRPNTDIGLIHEVVLEKHLEKKQTTLIDQDYILAWRYIHGRGNPKLRDYDWTYSVLPVTAFENDTTIMKLSASNQKKMKAVSKRMRTLLNKWEGKERVVTAKELGDVEGLD
jgi:poly-gamma-glutamate capsule biosynthesis protein CapA/YwtB (metallophosphatase superfamily)